MGGRIQIQHVSRNLCCICFQYMYTSIFGSWEIICHNLCCFYTSNIINTFLSLIFRRFQVQFSKFRSEFWNWQRQLKPTSLITVETKFLDHQSNAIFIVTMETYFIQVTYTLRMYLFGSPMLCVLHMDIFRSDIISKSMSSNNQTITVCTNCVQNVLQVHTE